jgi:LDH2 family malate/lactate/ureidoglycolate dehydrogenase
VGVVPLMMPERRLSSTLVATARAAGVARILLPGERGDAILAEREASGIPVPAGTWARLVKAAEGLGVKAPHVLSICFSSLRAKRSNLA